MEEISLKKLFNYYLNKRSIVILLFLFVLASGWIYIAFIEKSEYKSYTTLVLTMVNQGDSSDSLTQSDLNMNQNLVTTYREIIRSNSILKQVISDLNLNYSVSQLYNMINVTSVEDTEVIKITVSSENAAEAPVIANDIAKVFTERIVEIYNIENISIIDSAEQNNNKINMSISKQLLIIHFLALFVSLGVGFILYYFDKTIKDSKDLEEYIQIPLLGTIPQVMEEK